MINSFFPSEMYNSTGFYYKLYHSRSAKPCQGTLLRINPSRIYYTVNFTVRHTMSNYSSTPLTRCFFGCRTAVA